MIFPARYSVLFPALCFLPSFRKSVACAFRSSCSKRSKAGFVLVPVPAVHLPRGNNLRRSQSRRNQARLDDSKRSRNFRFRRVCPISSYLSGEEGKNPRIQLHGLLCRVNCPVVQQFNAIADKTRVGVSKLVYANSQSLIVKPCCPLSHTSQPLCPCSRYGTK